MICFKAARTREKRRRLLPEVLTSQIEPKVVGVEDVELLDDLEVFDVLRRHLVELEELYMSIVVHQGPALYICPSFRRNLHDEVGLGVNHILENMFIYTRRT